MRTALLARVSSEEQLEGYSIDAQRRAFQALVKGREWTVYREYIEEGKSARTDNINRRPVFKEMVNQFEENNIIVNYQVVPGDETFTASSGIRMGVQEMTGFGMKESGFQEMADYMSDVLLSGRNLAETT